MGRTTQIDGKIYELRNYIDGENFGKKPQDRIKEFFDDNYNPLWLKIRDYIVAKKYTTRRYKGILEQYKYDLEIAEKECLENPNEFSRNKLRYAEFMASFTSNHNVYKWFRGTGTTGVDKISLYNEIDKHLSGVKGSLIICKILLEQNPPASNIQHEMYNDLISKDFSSISGRERLL